LIRELFSFALVAALAALGERRVRSLETIGMDKKPSRQQPMAEAAEEAVRAVKEILRRQAELGAAGIGREELERARRRVAPRAGGRPNPAEALREIRRELGDCRRCRLFEGRTNIVFGDGDPYARLMFVGEGPGADEDAQGVPFVGRAGQKLNDIIEKGMKLKRSEVYIANVVKSRPPGNRDPQPDEIAACLPFLDRQIEVIHPEAIVALGTIAAQTLTGLDAPIGKLRGKWHEYKGIPLMPTYHPSYLVRLQGSRQEEAGRRAVWEDIQQVMEKLGLPVGSKT
jgi:DNA polymerase